MTEDINVILHLMKTVDPQTAITIAIGGGIIGFFKRFSNKIPQLIEQVLQEKLKKELKPDVPLFVKLSTEFSDVMDGYAKALACARILVFQYHNGSKLVNGQDFLKASCTFEFLNPKAMASGSKSIQKDFRNVPINYFNTFLKAFKKSNIVVLSANNPTRILDAAMKDNFKRNSIGGIIGAQLVDSDGCPFGFVAFEFNKNEQRDLNKLKNNVKDYMPKISTMLESLAFVETYNKS